jgi:methionyl-tRNA formyltransferase
VIRVKEKICVFIGSHRPEGKRDSGEDLVRALLNRGLNVTSVYVSPSDKLIKKRIGRCEFRPIPRLLRQPRKRILQGFLDEEMGPEWNRWLAEFTAEQYTLGVVYFGSWLPPELFRTPVLGFINFHPGPLPALRGFEAETWAILRDMKYFYGTVHRVSIEYDGGEIIWKTPRVRIRSRETPESLLKRTCYAGINHIQELVSLMHNDRLPGKPQDIMDGINASVRLMRRYGPIDWSSDSLGVLDRKNRAFNGQYISVDFSVQHGGQSRIIRDIKLIPGRFTGGLGKLVGYYRKHGPFYHQPIYQALDGQVILALYPAGEKKPDRASVFAGYNDSESLKIRSGP